MLCTENGFMVQAQYCSEWSELQDSTLVRFPCSESGLLAYLRYKTHCLFENLLGVSLFSIDKWNVQWAIFPLVPWWLVAHFVRTGLICCHSVQSICQTKVRWQIFLSAAIKLLRLYMYVSLFLYTQYDLCIFLMFRMPFSVVIYHIAESDATFSSKINST